MKTTIARCPLMDETVPIMRLSHNQRTHLRLPSLATCRDCPAGYTPQSCPLRNTFNTQLQVAIQAVLGEYQ